LKKLLTEVAKINKQYRQDYVITYAAGNIGMPDYYGTVIEPMLATLSFYGLTFEQQEILKNNMLIVGAIDTRPNVPQNYSNTSSNSGDYCNAFAMVDISDFAPNAPWGTSFAAPRALCYISQIMEETGLGAVEALALAKASICNNNGIFDINKILVKYVEFNGVKWATRNIGHYNCEEAQSACPAGWRLPTGSEMSNLKNQFSNGSATINGVKGWIFENGNNILFLPAAGQANTCDMPLADINEAGYYWGTAVGNNANWLWFVIAAGNLHLGNTNCLELCFSVRCVKE